MSFAHSIYKTGNSATQLALVVLSYLAFASICPGCSNSETSKEKIVKTDIEWRKQLTPLQYNVARQQGTEVAFKGEYTDKHDAGTYNCVACGNPLFSSSDKFDSKTGWPSFTKPANKENVLEKAETGRSEVVCAKCESHLGHVFPDGPQPTNSRYCINSCVLQFVSKDDR